MCWGDAFIYVGLKFCISRHCFYSWKIPGFIPGFIPVKQQTVGIQESNLEAKYVVCTRDPDMLHAH